MIAKTRTVAALLVVCFWGCSFKPPTTGEAAPRFKSSVEEDAYQTTVARYSDHAEVYDQLNTRMFAAATYQTWTFREARVQRLAEFQRQTPEEMKRKLEIERQELDSFHEFFFGAHVNENRFDDFDKRNSIWRIAMVTEVGEALPAQVYRVGRADINMRAIYPYMDDFWVAYRIRFPRVAADGTPLVVPSVTRVTLRVASTLGSIDLRFPTQ